MATIGDHSGQSDAGDNGRDRAGPRPTWGRKGPLQGQWGSAFKGNGLKAADGFLPGTHTAITTSGSLLLPLHGAAEPHNHGTRPAVPTTARDKSHPIKPPLRALETGHTCCYADRVLAA